MTTTESAENEGLLVRRIKNGTVIDHIASGEALNVVKILGITGTTQEALSIATNVPSRNMGRGEYSTAEAARRAGLPSTALRKWG